MVDKILKRLDEEIKFADHSRDINFRDGCYSQVAGYAGIATGLTKAKRIILEEIKDADNQDTEAEKELVNIKKVIKRYIASRQRYNFLALTSCGQKLEDASEDYNAMMSNLEDASR